MNETQIHYRQYLRILKRRKSLLLLATAICLVAGALVSKKVTPTYRASTIVGVETADTHAGIPTTSSQNLQRSLKTILPQLESRARLELVAERAGLRPGPGEGPNDVLSRIAQTFRAELTGKDTVESFEIFYSGSDPTMVRNVTNALAEVFVEQNHLEQVRDAENSVEFLQRDLGAKAKELKDREDAISKFRERQVDVLPDQYGANATRLSMVSQDLAAVEQKLRAAREQLATVRAQTLGSQKIDIQAQLEDEERKLSELRATLTERHPDVAASRERIRQLKEYLASLPEVGDTGREPLPKLDPKLQADLENAQWEVKRLEGEERALSATVRNLNQKVRLAPKIQAEFEDLTRGYNALDESYKAYKKRLEDAKTRLSLERANQGDHFSVLEPAELPRRPSSPDPLMVMPLSLFIGLALGVGCILLAEMFNDCFYTLEELSAATGVLLLGGIARITTEMDTRRMKRRRLYWAAFSLVVTLVVGWALVS